MTYWIITDSSGAVIESGFATSSPAEHPKDCGFDWIEGEHTATPIDDAPDPLVQSWFGTGYAEDAAKVEALLIARVKARAGTAKALAMTPEPGKDAIYAAKRAEVIAWADLGSDPETVFEALDPALRAQRWRYAVAEASIRGETGITEAIARYASGMAVADAEVSRLEAIEQAAVAAIKAAALASDKRDVEASIDWDWNA